MSTIQDTDLLLVNRGGTDYKVTVEDLHEYFNPKPPWEEDALGILHLIVDDPDAFNNPGGDFSIYDHEKIYNLDTHAEVSSIDAPGEYIIACKKVEFRRCSGNWEFGPLTDTRGIVAMDYMFAQCKKFNADISNWDVSNVKVMDSMFYACSAFNQDLSKWCVNPEPSHDFFDNGANAAWEDKNKPCWGHCPRGEHGLGEDTCPGPPWEGHNGGIFHVIIDDPADIKPTMGDVNKIYNLATEAPVNSIDAPGEYIILTEPDIHRLFEDSPGNWDFGEFTDTSRLTDMSLMFNRCTKFNSDIGDWDVSNVTVFKRLMYKAAEFNQDLSQWCVINDEDHEAFDGNCPAWEDKNKPVWGTCPRGENNNP